jgi:ribulose 1,5-bisphosphate carboxylase large subunit-like protein
MANILEKIDPKDAVIATYYLETDEDLTKVAEKMGWEETIGGQLDFDEMSELLNSCVGRLHSVEEFEKGKGIVKILLPIKNMDYKNAPFAHIWMFIAGGPAFELTSYKKIRLLDIQPPPELMKYFPGPLLGIKGFRKYLGVDDDTLLLGAIVKPCCGLTEEEVAEFIYESAMAGVHLIKDDEKMNNVEYCQLAKRTKLVHEKLNQVKETTGMKPLYVTNVTTRPDKILDNARIARDNGAEGLMLNMFAAGFDSIAILREAPDINLPIYIHSGTRSALGRVEGQGIELNVIAKFARYLGGDFFRTGIYGGYCVGTQEQFDTANRSLQESIPGIMDTIPTLSGGLRAGHMPMNIKLSGLDVVYMAGSSYAGHPMGTKAGVKAFVQAAEAYHQGIQIEKYAESHPELKAAIDKWGYSNA